VGSRGVFSSASLQILFGVFQAAQAELHPAEAIEISSVAGFYVEGLE
jgi:hypothetical protein